MWLESNTKWKQLKILGQVLKTSLVCKKTLDASPHLHCNSGKLKHVTDGEDSSIKQTFVGINSFCCTNTFPCFTWLDTVFTQTEMQCVLWQSYDVVLILGAAVVQCSMAPHLHRDLAVADSRTTFKDWFKLLSLALTSIYLNEHSVLYCGTIAHSWESCHSTNCAWLSIYLSNSTHIGNF